VNRTQKKIKKQKKTKPTKQNWAIYSILSARLADEYATVKYTMQHMVVVAIFFRPPDTHHRQTKVVSLNGKIRLVQ